MKAVKCPVCEGTGVYRWTYPTDTVSERSSTCHGCGGKGWVEVHEDNYDNTTWLSISSGTTKEFIPDSD